MRTAPLAPPPPDPLLACAAYRRIAGAIAALRLAGRDPPDLGTLAGIVGMKPLTLQRAFSAWAGVSPKRFAQVLAAARARVALRREDDVLSAALEAGLSGPGRLHDLLVTVEGVTPGDMRTRGAGLTFDWGVGPTPFGEAFVAVTPRGVHRLAFVEGRGEVEIELAALREAWPLARLHEDHVRARRQLACAFVRGRAPVPFHLWVRGTNLQLAVWRALLRLPPGALTTYGTVARFVQAPRAVRAVASAVATNPIAWLIPCHRVLRQDGAWGGYAWGLDRKAALVGHEALRGAARYSESPMARAT